jgi:formyl-CoA transferase
MQHEELGPLVAPGVVPKLSDTPGMAAWTGSYEFGGWNAEVYQGLLGLGAEELAELSREGVI